VRFSARGELFAALLSFSPRCSAFPPWPNPSDSCKINFSATAWKEIGVMARVCDICGKGPQFGNTISHAHNVSKRRWNVNLRPVHAKVGAATKHIRVCTSCLRSGKVVKA
jgi:large subunit ribosomal protein L28